MSLELLGRIQQELSITGSAVYETVLALAERANRKVQVLRLHGQASSLLSQIEQGHGDIGRHISSLCAKRPPFSHQSILPSDQLEGLLSQASDRIQQLKQTLLNIPCAPYISSTAWPKTPGCIGWRSGSAGSHGPRTAVPRSASPSRRC